MLKWPYLLIILYLMGGLCFAVDINARELTPEESTEFKKVLKEKLPAEIKILDMKELAGLYESVQEYEKALPLRKKILAARKKHMYGKYDPRYVQSLNKLANLYVLEGKYRKALPLNKEATEMIRKLLGGNHAFYANDLNNIALLNGLIKQDNEALKYFIRAEKIVSKNMLLYFNVSTEKEKLDYVKYKSPAYHAMLSFILERFNHNEEALHAALNLVLSRKGIVFDAQSHQLQDISKSQNTEIKFLWHNIVQKRASLSSLSISKLNGMNSKGYRHRFELLQGELEKLEKTLAQKSAHFAQMSKYRKITEDNIVRNLNENAVLIEFVKIKDFDWARGKWAGTSRYIAFTLNHAGNVKLIDLGNAGKLESEVKQCLEAIKPFVEHDKVQVPNEKQQVLASRKLYDLIWHPIAANVGVYKDVIVSPDGILNLVPFNAFRNKKGHFLIEDKDIVYVTSGRDLAKSFSGFQPESDLFIAASPQFNLKDSSSLVGNKNHRMGELARQSRLNFSPLPGAAKEVKLISNYFMGKKIILTGKNATKSAVMLAQRPKVMHLATHAFFKDQSTLTVHGLRTGAALNSSNTGIELFNGLDNSLTHSGMAWAGANDGVDPETHSDGLLTALDVTTMDLHGTDLVTLSACDTGVGNVNRLGEGVFGFRRSFALAGAKHLVMSLWKVEDDITAKQMDNFYSRYSQGVPPAIAMRETQLSTIAQLRQTNRVALPSLWAPFIVQGWK